MNNILKLRIFVVALFLCLFHTVYVSAQTENTELPYQMDAPENWRHEHFSLPTPFAPKLTVTGSEEIRFHPGWEDAKSDGNLSYVFLWWVPGKTDINSKILGNNLEIYFTGLVNYFAEKQRIPADKIIKTEASLSKAPTVNGDRETYSGKLHLLNPFSQEVTDLNIKIHVLKISSKTNKPVRFEVSPKDFSDNMWEELRGVTISFKPAL
ncbi:hypothetical protein [Mucilaginibacter sp.]|jgi:hypothetical protein|uniref:hypothetical protein n=1 Tax=Mucilaginibacter sp. TaxID=1882438 RepID=UPI00356A395F